jgi:Cu(I)/Ag(I) efflux system protein CusF
MKTPATLALLAALAFGVPAFGQGATDHSSHHGAAEAALTDGEVRRVDKEAKKLTIKHDPIVYLDMPAMTMVFQVKDPAMLDQVAAGEKIRFRAEKIGGAFIVTRIEPAK